MKTYYINARYGSFKSTTIAKSIDWDEADRWVSMLDRLKTYKFIWIADERRAVK